MDSMPALTLPDPDHLSQVAKIALLADLMCTEAPFVREKLPTFCLKMLMLGSSRTVYSFSNGTAV